MKYQPWHFSVHFFLSLAFVLSGSVAHGQDTVGPMPKKARTEADYQPRTLRELTATASLSGRELGAIPRGDIMPSRVRAAYRGATRSMPESRKRVLLKWAQQYAGSVEHYTLPYQTEMLFREDGTEHWLAVRREIVPQVEKAIKKGEAVDLRLIRVGGVRADGKWEWVLLVESFQKKCSE